MVARGSRGRSQGPSQGERNQTYGTGHGQVVQRREGVRLHPGRGRRGRLRPLQRHPGPGLQEPGRGRQGRIRGHQGSEGTTSLQRPQGLISPTDHLTARRVLRRVVLFFSATEALEQKKAPTASAASVRPCRPAGEKRDRRGRWL